MSDGVEIVITPRHIERVVYSFVIITLAVLLIIKWGGGSCGVDDNETTGAVLAQMADNESNQTINNTSETDSLCSNGDKDQDETDTDCGGSTCDPCPEFGFCNVDDDCESGWCRGSVKCVTPTCDDGEKNQDESNVDCGGTVCGGFFYDGECHDEPQTRHSGRVDLTIIEVETSVNIYDDNENAKIETVKFKVENGKSEDVILTAFIYLRDSSGTAYFMRYGVEEKEVPKGEVDIPLLAQGESFTETVDIGITLIETDPDEEYQVVIELRDDDDKLVNTETWENS